MNNLNKIYTINLNEAYLNKSKCSLLKQMVCLKQTVLNLIWLNYLV